MIPASNHTGQPTQTAPHSRSDPTLQDFLLECLYPVCLSIAAWIERKYKPEAAAERAAFAAWKRAQR